MERELIGMRVREARKRLGLTQEQLAASVFISESYLTLIEQGKRSMSIDILLKLSKKLGVTTDYLLDGCTGEGKEQFWAEWNQIMAGRSDGEIKAGHDVLRSFFGCLDKAQTPKKGKSKSSKRHRPAPG